MRSMHTVYIARQSIGRNEGYKLTMRLSLQSSVPCEGGQERVETQSRSMVVRSRGRMTLSVKGARENFWDDRNSLYHDCGGYIVIHIYQNSWN